MKKRVQTRGVIKTKGKLRLKTQNVVRFFNFAFQHRLLTYIFIQRVSFLLFVFVLFCGFFLFGLVFKFSLRI